MADELLELADVAARDPRLCGSKAATLATLLADGFPVLPGLVITTHAVGDGLDALPEPVTIALMLVHERMGAGPLVVRSSAVAEDLDDASFAGIYETVLDVRGPAALAEAVRRCLAAANRVPAHYRTQRGLPADPGFAILIQPYVRPERAGVAFSANPVTGERGVVVITSVVGHPGGLLDGEAEPEVWEIRGRRDARRGGDPAVLTRRQAHAVAALVRRVEARLGQLVDVEWAMVDGRLVVLQARPMTSVPEEVSWAAPRPGGWSRTLRLGEWLPEPVTPLFATWPLRRIDGRLAERQASVGGVRARGPLHVLVHGWYFHSPVGGGGAGTLVGGLLRRPRLAVAAVLATRRPGAADRLAYARLLRDWRVHVLQPYERAVAFAEQKVDHATPAELTHMVDELTDAVGDVLWSLVLAGGMAWRSELALARFCRRHLRRRADVPYQRLLGGLVQPQAHPHLVHSLDWFRPTLGESDPPTAPTTGAGRFAQAVRDRQRTEQRYRQALSRRRRLTRRFDQLLATAQRYAVLRAEHSASFTLAWPVLRRCVHRLGEELERSGVVAAEEIHFLTRDEVAACVAGAAPDGLAATAARRRHEWQAQRKLTPPLEIGRSTLLLSRLLLATPRFTRAATPANGRTLAGIPASPGRATGPVRVVRDLTAADDVQAGDVLVVPATPPAITALFDRIAAVCVDGGSVAAHASIVAREYGLPMVVGLREATSRLADHWVVSVDGGAGTVHIDLSSSDEPEEVVYE